MFDRPRFICFLWVCAAGLVPVCRAQPLIQSFEFGQVVGLAVSPDGRTFAAAGAAGVQLFDLDSTRTLGFFSGHADWVELADFSSDGRRLVTAGWDGVARLWDVASGAELRAFAGHDALVHSAVFSPDDRQVLTASWDKTAKLWDADGGALLRTFSGHSDIVEYAVFSPDGRQVLTCSYDLTARLWNAADGQLLRAFVGHEKGIQTAFFSPDGAMILTASFDGTARLWDAATGRQIRVFRGHTDGLHSAVFSPDGARILSASWDRTAKVWETASGRLLLTLAGHQDAVLYALFTPDATRILTGSNDRTVRLWDAASGSLIRQYEAGTGLVLAAAIAPDAAAVAFGLRNGNAAIMDARTGHLLHMLTGHRGPVGAVGFAPGGGRVFTASDDGTARLWDASTGAFQFAFASHGGAVRALAFSPDERTVLTGSDDGHARWWDVESGAALQDLPGDAGPIRALAFSLDGAAALTASDDGTLVQWHLAEGRLLRQIATRLAHPISVAFSDNGSDVLLGLGDGQLQLWQTNPGKLVRTFAAHDGPVRAVAFSPDGRLALSGSDDRTARLWSLSSGREIHRSAESSPVIAVAFNAHGGQMLIAAAGGVARLMDIPPLRSFRGFLRWAVLLAILLACAGALRMVRRRRGGGRTTLPASHPLPPPRTQGRRQRLVFRILAVALSLLVFIPVAELILRLWLTVNYRGTLEHLPPGLPDDFSRAVRLGDLIQVDPNPALGYRLRPRARAQYRGVRVQISDQGYRDDSITTKTPDALRVLGLGDSSMFGFSVLREQVYLEVLEAEFRGLLADRCKVEFINTAVPGYNAVQELALFRDSGLAMNPDAVLIQFDPNDFMVPAGSVKPDFLFARYLFLVHPLRLWKGELSDAEAFYRLNQADRLYDSPSPYGGRMAVEEAYRQLAALCHDRDIPIFGLFLYSDYPPAGEDSVTDPRYRFVHDLWREIDIKPIETYPIARAYLLKHNLTSWLSICNGPEDPHPNVIGHGLIAQAVLPVLAPEMLKRLALDPRSLPRYDALGNIALRQMTGIGLHQTENWDGLSVNWTSAFAHFQFIPAGRKLIVPMMIGHPDLSPHAPVLVHIRIDGVPTAAHPSGRVEHDFGAFQRGYVTRTIDLDDLAGNPLDFTITVNRAFHTATDPRSLGVALYPLGFQD